MVTRRAITKTVFKLFDSQIQPMLTYGAEVWGLNGDNHIIKTIHLFAMKRLLNVSIKTPNALVHGESGRHPLYENTYTKCIKYWLHNYSKHAREPSSFEIIYNVVLYYDVYLQDQLGVICLLCILPFRIWLCLGESCGR